MSYYEPKSQKYAQAPEVIFDFHGYTTAECKEVLDEVISEKIHKHIRIIVGKGLNSVNGPILPDFVKGYLNERGIRYSQSKIQNGGEGALEVFLS